MMTSLGRRDGLLYALVAAAAFGFASVAVYFVNDVADAERWAGELGARVLEYLNTEHPTGTLFPDGTSAFLTTNTDANAAELERKAGV